MTETLQKCQMYAWTATAPETRWKQLQMKWRMSERVETCQKCKTHQTHPKMGHPSLPINGERSASTILVHTYHRACLLRHWAEHLSSERPRVGLRWLCPVLMAETSRRGLATKMVMMVMVTTQKATAMLTHSKSKVHGCLQRVSTCAHTEDLKKTHLCCPGHPSNL